jgi:ABC-type enterobactin transport system permease subunit
MKQRIEDMRKTGQNRYRIITVALIAALAAVMVASVTLGRYPIGLKELWGILVSQWVEMEPYWTKTQESLLLVHRLPRILLACLVAAVWQVPARPIRVCSRTLWQRRTFWALLPAPPLVRPWPF